MLDKTMLNLLSLVIAAHGILFALVRFNPREAIMTFFDKNLYLLKRDIIDDCKKFIFAIVTIAGLAIQAIPILHQHIPERIYPVQYYPRWTLTILILTFLISLILEYASRLLGKRVSRRRLIPELKPNFEIARDVIENRTEKKYDLEGILNRIEDLLDLHPATENLEERFMELSEYFVDT